MKYRKKPVVIDAEHWDGTAKGASPIIAWIIGENGAATYWCSDPSACSVGATDPRHTIAIQTLEGTMHATTGDWIIRGVQGEYYPCKPDIFDATYEPA